MEQEEHPTYDTKASFTTSPVWSGFLHTAPTLHCPSWPWPQTLPRAVPPWTTHKLQVPWPRSGQRSEKPGASPEPRGRGPAGLPGSTVTLPVLITRTMFLHLLPSFLGFQLRTDPLWHYHCRLPGLPATPRPSPVPAGTATLGLQRGRSEAFYGLSDGWESRLGPALLRYSIRGHNFSQLKQRACITQLSILDSSAHGEHP